tara:strand:+ start:83 stop:193 length:111 start_codon:yes stop_codon:yes gene_type:complete
MQTLWFLLVVMWMYSLSVAVLLAVGIILEEEEPVGL